MAKISKHGPDPAKVASNVYKKLFENSKVRVFDVRFKPGDKAVMHWHPNHLAYILEGGTLELSPPKGEAIKMPAKAGDVAWIDAGHHEAINRGSSEIRAVIVEFKGSTKKLRK